MARGVAGYGRYDSDPGYVGCPWVKSDMSPCVARDGRLALTAAPSVCVGCGNTPRYLLRDLAGDYGPAARADVPGKDARVAELFRDLVRQATEPEGRTDDARPDEAASAGPPA